MDEVTGLALLGCGRLGEKRARAFAANPGVRVAALFDVDPRRTKALGAQFADAVVGESAEAAIAAPGVDAAVVSTPHDGLVPLALAAVRRGKHVLVEKPAGRSTAELGRVAEAASAARVVVQVGYNHRFHPGIRAAKRLLDEGAIGPFRYLRGRYGHGGRPGYEKEWRSDPVVAGGGELLDQGVHLIDLARWLAGDLRVAHAALATYFWQAPVEDNAFLHLARADGAAVWLHVSTTEWKNLFNLEIFGRDGKLEVSGLGGSYGVERLTHYRMLPEMGPPETTSWEYPMADRSLEDENADFLARLAGRPAIGAALEDGLAVLAIVDQAYRLAKERA